LSDALSNRIGFWAALVVVALELVYLLLLIGYFAVEGFTYPPGKFVQTVGGIVTILSAPAILVLFAAIWHLSPPEKTPYATIALCFTVLFTAMVSINRFVQLTVIRLEPVGRQSAELARFQPYATDSVMFALEILGWGLFLSLATLFAAPVFSGGRLQQAIRWSFALFALFSVMSVIGYATATPLTAAAFVAWGPLLLLLGVLLAEHFRRGLAGQSAGIEP
jgi:hypothetical protein